MVNLDDFRQDIGTLIRRRCLVGRHSAKERIGPSCALSRNLTEDAHTIRIENTGLTSGSGIWVVIDKVSVSYNYLTI